MHLMALIVPPTEGPDGALDPADSSCPTQTASAAKTQWHHLGQAVDTGSPQCSPQKEKVKSIAGPFHVMLAYLLLLRAGHALAS